jgi:uncharacterized membrane protein
VSLAKKTDMAIAVALVALVAALVVWFRSVDLDAGATTTESDAAGQPLPKAGRSLTVALGMTVPPEMLIFPAGAW